MCAVFQLLCLQLHDCCECCGPDGFMKRRPSLSPITGISWVSSWKDNWQWFSLESRESYPGWRSFWVLSEGRNKLAITWITLLSAVMWAFVYGRVWIRFYSLGPIFYCPVWPEAQCESAQWWVLVFSQTRAGWCSMAHARHGNEASRWFMKQLLCFRWHCVHRRAESTLA